MIVVDASVWIAHFVSSDTFHRQSRLWLEGQLRARQALSVPALALAEIAGAISRRTRSPDLGLVAVQELLALTALDVVELTRRWALTAAELAARLGLRGGDAVYVALAQECRAPLVTWDEEILTRAATVIDVHTPPS